jgi:hypothetical protein
VCQIQQYNFTSVDGFSVASSKTFSRYVISEYSAVIDFLITKGHYGA